MKKLASFVLALAMAAVCAAPAMADNNQITQESDPKSCDTTVTFTIAPSYTVTIPAATDIPFNSTGAAARFRKTSPYDSLYPAQRRCRIHLCRIYKGRRRSPTQRTY